VFGSPKNRVRGDLPLNTAMSIACDFFQELGGAAASHGVSLCIEANPAAYGCDFVTTTAEAVELCRRVNHPAIRVNGDLGGMTMSGETPALSLEDAGPWIGHFHASEPQLAELGTAGADHAGAARGLEAIGYDGWVSIEMRDTGDLASVDRAVARAKAAYGTARDATASPRPSVP
jgi:D-psicose/D-tagatose/L-ribulose 3-epimerase